MLRPTLNRICWARSLGGCSLKLSNEHILSKSVNKAMSGELGVRLPHASNKWVGTNAVKIGILCTTHNGMLSDIDTEAGRFVAEIRKYHAKPPGALSDGAPPFVTVIIDGNKLERWGLKTFLNHAAWCAHMPADSPSRNISGSHILGYVFGNGPRPDDFGLFVHPERAPKIFELAARTAETTIFSPTTGELSSPSKLPLYLGFTLFGVQMVICGNITTELDNQGWRSLMHGRPNDPTKLERLRSCVCAYRTPSQGCETFTRLRLLLRWD